MTNKKMTEVEVRKVANGYIVMSPHRYRDSALMNEDVYVFQTFGALALWLQVNFELGKPE